MIAQPSIKDYQQWVADRNARTAAVMAKQTKITGRQCLEENLSLRMLYDNGYELNTATDTLEKQNG